MTLLFLLVCCIGFTARADETRLNILFIAADDLRMNLGCYGDPVAVTPNLDRLATKSVVYEQAYCQFPSCNASRASILTGMRPDSLSVWHLNENFRKINPDVMTLPQQLREQGYHTESIGKILHNYNEVRDNEKSWSVPARFDQVNHYKDYASPENREKGRKAGPVVEMEDVPDTVYADGRIAIDAANTIRRLAGQKKPFFLAVGFLKPHSPFNAPARYWDLYNRADMHPLGPESRPDGVPEQNWFYYNEIRSFPEFPDEGTPSPELARQIRHGYYAATSFLDANVGILLDSIKTSGLADNTIVVFWSDHGYHLGENGHWSKVTARDLDGHVPLIIHVPGKAPARSQAIVEYIDLFPTLLELCDLPPAGGIDGISFSDTIDNPGFPAREAALTQVCRPWPGGKIEQMGYSITNSRFRYTQWIDVASQRILAEELYDQQSDPLQRQNLGSTPEHDETLSELRTLMKRVR